MFVVTVAVLLTPVSGETPASVRSGLSMRVYVNLGKAEIQDIKPSSPPFGSKIDASGEFSNKTVSRDLRLKDAISTDYAVEWSGWINVSVQAPQSLIVSLGENRRQMPKNALIIAIDGRNVISLPWKYSVKARLAVGQVHLEPGWHSITIRMLVGRHSELKTVPLSLRLVPVNKEDGPLLTPADMFVGE